MNTNSICSNILLFFSFSSYQVYHNRFLHCEGRQKVPKNFLTQIAALLLVRHLVFFLHTYKHVKNGNEYRKKPMKWTIWTFLLQSFNITAFHDCKHCITLNFTVEFKMCLTCQHTRSNICIIQMARKIYTKTGKCHEFIWNLFVSSVQIYAFWILCFCLSICPWHSPIVNHIETRTTLLTENCRLSCSTLAISSFFSLLRGLHRNSNIHFDIETDTAEKSFGSQQVVYIRCTSTSCSYKIKFNWLYIVHAFLICLSQTFEITCMDRRHIVFNVQPFSMKFQANTE